MAAGAMKSDQLISLPLRTSHKMWNLNIVFVRVLTTFPNNHFLLGGSLSTSELAELVWIREDLDKLV